MTETNPSAILKPARPVGIIGYGAYVPRYRLPASEVARVWTGGKGGLPIKEKAVPGLDEDVITMSIEAARNALARAGIDPQLTARRVGRLRIAPLRRQTHLPPSWPRPSAPPRTSRPPTGNSPARPAPKPWSPPSAWSAPAWPDYALAIGMDTAQGKPGDALEYTAAAGGAAFIIGPAEESLAVIEASYSYVTDTPDFWRRAEQQIPRARPALHRRTGLFQAHHRGRPAPDGSNLAPRRRITSYAIFHQPNTKFPQRAAATARLHAGADHARPALAGDRQHLRRRRHDRPDRHPGHGQTGRPHSDGFLWLRRRFGCLCLIASPMPSRNAATWPPRPQDYIARRTEIDYATYARYRGKLAMK